MSSSETETPLYALWRVDDPLSRTGWITHNGRVIVSGDAAKLARAALSGTEVREYPEPIGYDEWMRTTK